MAYYRLYFMNPGNGHIMRFAEFEAPDDDAAIALALEHEGGSPLELWCQKRKVMRVEAEGVNAPDLVRSAKQQGQD